MSLAVLTFTLIFLFPQDQAGKVHRLLFHLTLDVIVAGLFALTLSTLFYRRSIVGFPRDRPGAHGHLVFGYVFLVTGMALFTLAPALLLLTVQLWDVGAVAIVLWLLLQVLTVMSHQEFT